jgi:hypothetical protein
MACSFTTVRERPEETYDPRIGGAPGLLPAREAGDGSVTGQILAGGVATLSREGVAA